MFCRVCGILFALCGGAGVTIASMAQAQTYNAASDFSPTLNPTGVWQYGYMNTLGSSFILDTITVTDPQFQAWEGTIPGLIDSTIHISFR